jgi:hypothetical protein
MNSRRSFATEGCKSISLSPVPRLKEVVHLSPPSLLADVDARAVR